MIDISIVSDGSLAEFGVALRTEDGRTDHTVTLASADFERWTGGRASKVQLVEAAFRFLLDREPADSILRSFDLAIIGHYFPDFDTAIAAYLERVGP